MISKHDISKLAKKVLKHQKGLRDHHIIHPEREWAIGLLGGLLILLAGGAWTFVTYQEVRERGVENTETAEIIQTIYHHDLISETLTELEERKSQYLKMIDENRASLPIEEVEEEPVEEEEVVEEEEPADVPNEETTDEVETVDEVGVTEGETENN